MKKNILLAFIAVCFVIPFHAEAAVFSLSPSSDNVVTGNAFYVNVILNTQNQQIDGVDAILNYNPALLEVQDSNATAPGIQIAPGGLMPVVAFNGVDPVSGKIMFSQVPNPGTTYNGSGTLATIAFRALAAGSATALFEFAPGNTTDSNVAFNGTDVLTSATGGTYAITGQTVPPTPPPAPSGGPGVPSPSYLCDHEWRCSEWSGCIDGSSARSCTFVQVTPFTLTKPCPSKSASPPASQRCTPTAISQIEVSCNDGVKNLDEEEVDCGGVCKPCTSEDVSQEPAAQPVSLETKSKDEASFDYTMWISLFMAITGIILGASIVVYARHRKKVLGATAVPEKKVKKADEKIYDEVIAYITDLRSKGLLDGDIKNALRQTGWKDEVIEEIFGKLREK